MDAYEKKYKALIEAVKTLKETNPSDEGIQNWVNDNVPELAESEDERIRKALIKYLDALDDDEIRYGVSFKDMRTWLEKQSKKSKVEQAMREVEEKADAFTEAHKGETSDEILAQMRGEQKPNPCDGCINRKGCINCENGELRETEQKPAAWSEEDERNIDYIIDKLKTINDVRHFVCICWLKSIKDRVQPKQEWSEDDEVKINRIVACLENLNVADNDILLKDVAWLKSFRPRNNK